jgi:PhnB protein
MNQHVRPPPDALPRITPHLVVDRASAALALYEKALGAKELYRTVGRDGRILFSEMLLHDSRFFVVDEFPEQGALSPRTLGGTPVTLHVYVDDVDAAFVRATAAGMTPVMPPANFFWGERYAQVKDPSGHQWALAQRIEDLTPDEVQRRADSFYRSNRS